jgi:hypothetical protein
MEEYETFGSHHFLFFFSVYNKFSLFPMKRIRK